MGLFRKLAVKLMDDKRLRVEKRNDDSIPESLHFNMERHMPIVDIPLARGYLIFPSVQSFDKFSENGDKENIDSLDSNGMGIPLFQIKRQLLTPGLTMIETELTYKIYKYEIKQRDDVPPYGDFEIIAENQNFKVYKYLYGKVYKSSKMTQSALQFVINNDVENSYFMLHKREFRDMDTCIDGYNFRWHVRYSPMENDHYKLALLNPKEVSLMDSPSVKSMKKKNNITKIDPYSLVFGHYTSENEDLIPSMIMKSADFIIGEKGVASNIGLSNVPELTQKFACQALVLHVIERQKEEERDRKHRHRNGFRMGLQNNQMGFPAHY